MKNIIKKGIISIIIGLSFVAIPAGAITLWYLDGTTLKPVDSSWTIDVPMSVTGLNLTAGSLIYGDSTGAGTQLASSTEGKVLKISSVGYPAWETESGSTADGSNGYIQFNDWGALGSDSSFSFATTTDTLTMANASTTLLTSTTSWLGTISSGIWNGTEITDTYISNDLTVNGYMEDTDINTLAKLNTWLPGESVASTTQIWDFSDYTNATASTNITFTDDAISVTDPFAVSNATTTLLTATTSWLGNILSGVWNGTAIDIGTYTNLTAGDHITLTDDDLDVDDDFLLNDGDTGTGTYDFSGATLKQHTYPAFSFPPGLSMATTTVATTSIPIGTAYTAQSFGGAECWSGAGTVIFAVTDGTNDSDYISATTTASRFSFSTGNTFTAGEKRFIEIGAMTSSYLTCSFDITINN